MADERRSMARASAPARSQINPKGRRKPGGTLGCTAGGALLELGAVVVMVSRSVCAVVLVTSTEGFAKVQVAPVGQPLATLRSTIPVNTFSGDTLIVEVPGCPGAEMVTGEGFADRVKSETAMADAAEVDVP